MDKLVLDTSLILKWVLRKDEQDLSKAKKIYDLVVSKKAVGLAPEFVLTEVINVLFWKEEFSIGKILDFVEFLKTVLVIKPFDMFDYSDLLGVMNRRKLTIFDAHFALLAEANACKIATFDKGFGDLMVEL